MSVPAMPPEVWSHILQNVPPFEQPKLLQVSPTFHEIALGLVFSSVKIYFIGGDEVYNMLNTDHEEFASEITTKLMTRSWEILRRITLDPSFARVIRSLNVITASDSESIFEQLCLADAVSALPNLRSFRWFGTTPHISEAVAGRIPANIRSMVFQTYVPPTELMQRFQNVANLALPTPFFYPDDEEAHDDIIVEPSLLDITASLDFSGIIENLALDSLVSLTLNAEYVSAIPIRVLTALKQLDICVTKATPAIGLDLVFRHALMLESLTIFGFIDELMLSWFLCDPSNLPALHSFRLSCDNYTMRMPPSMERMDILLKFLSDRPHIRRLYLHIPSINSTHLSSLQPVIKRSTALEVFGLHTGTTAISDEFASLISEFLPSRLKALHLAIDWVGSSILPLVDYFAQLPNLTFLHLYGVHSRLPLLLHDVAMTAQNLQMVGLNRALWDIDRSGAELELRKWFRWKIKFCTPEDFLCDDDYWLFKYH